MPRSTFTSSCRPPLIVMLNPVSPMEAWSDGAGVDSVRVAGGDAIRALKRDPVSVKRVSRRDSHRSTGRPPHRQVERPGTAMVSPTEGHRCQPAPMLARAGFLMRRSSFQAARRRSGISMTFPPDRRRRARPDALFAPSGSREGASPCRLSSPSSTHGRSSSSRRSVRRRPWPYQPTSVDDGVKFSRSAASVDSVRLGPRRRRHGHFLRAVRGGSSGSGAGARPES